MKTKRRQNSGRRSPRRSRLEVSAAARERWFSWLRGIARLAALTAGVLAVGAGLWAAGGWAMDRLLFQNDYFNIVKIEAKSDGDLRPDWIVRWSNLRLNQNLLAIDLNEIRRDLEAVPQILEAHLERDLPGSLRIYVKERIPIARVPAVEGRANGVGLRPMEILLDREGVVMRPIRARRDGAAVAGGARRRLPALHVSDREELMPGRRVRSPKIVAALRFLETFEDSPLHDRVDVSEVDLSDSRVLRVRTRDGASVLVGLTDFAGQLRRWRMIHDYGRETERRLERMDLSITNNVPAIWRSPADSQTSV